MKETQIISQVYLDELISKTDLPNFNINTSVIYDEYKNTAEDICEKGT